MNRLLICGLLLAIASPALAGSIRPAAAATDPTTEDPYIKYFMRGVNGDTCQSYGLPRNCDQNAATAAAATCANTNLPPGCSQAEATAAAIALGRVMPVIYGTNQAAMQDYGSVIWNRMVHDWIAQGKALKTSKQLPDAYLALDPSIRAQIDTLAGIQ